MTKDYECMDSSNALKRINDLISVFDTSKSAAKCLLILKLAYSAPYQPVRPSNYFILAACVAVTPQTDNLSEKLRRQWDN